ncbi:MAG TPA: 3-hydroxyacyl-ACP dehydratase FabZ, partial [Usitatibacter sp.]|nr:3-hydroxyacyl-ACP dehydratase FabZ [Usitatibacter sp.]
MTIEEIKEYLPHRHPFLLIDRVIAFEKDKRVVAIKNVTVNEPFFPGHFPHFAVMPGVLIVEAMAQVGGMLMLNTVDDPGNSLIYFMGIDGAKFRRPVVPGDQLHFKLELLSAKRRVMKMRGEVFVDGQLVAE